MRERHASAAVVIGFDATTRVPAANDFTAARDWLHGLDQLCSDELDTAAAVDAVASRGVDDPHD